MAKLKTISPTGSYSLVVPTGVNEDVDGNTVSLWIAGDDTLLQFSSRRRETGGQVSARERLRARLEGGELHNLRAVAVDIPACDEVAAASGMDDEGTTWLYVYAVWPDVAVFLTVSHPTRDPTGPSWAFDAMRSLRRS
jgi:hypothetical protein